MGRPGPEHTALRRYDHLVELKLAVIAVGTLSIAALVGVGAAHGDLRIRTLVSAVGLIVGFGVASKRLGGLVVAAPAFLLPTLPGRFGVPYHVQLGLITLALAVVHWYAAGRPRFSVAAVLTGAVLSAALVIFGLLHDTGLDLALWLPLVSTGAVLLGACLANDARDREIFLIAYTSIALFAIAYLLGLPNPWPHLFHLSLSHSSQETGALRGESTFGSPLIAGGCLAMLAAFALQSRLRWATALAAIYAAGAIATVSRSALIGIAVAMAVSLLFAPQRLRRLSHIFAVAIVGLAILTAVPQIHESFSNRTTNQRYTNQTVREYAVTAVRNRLQSDPSSLLVGGGENAVTRRLDAIGGVRGYYIFDNAYATILFQIGLIALIVTFGLGLRALSKGGAASQSLGIPALVAVLVVMYFTDGLAWVPMVMAGWLGLGLASAPLDAGSATRLS